MNSHNTAAVMLFLPNAIAIVKADGPTDQAADDGSIGGEAFAIANAHVRLPGWCNCTTTAKEVLLHGWPRPSRVDVLCLP